MTKYWTVIVFVVRVVVRVRLFLHGTFQITNLTKVWNNTMQQLVKLFTVSIFGGYLKFVAYKPESV